MLQACGESGTEPWHRAEFAAEFTADRTDVKSFEAYRSLEDDVFAELTEEVYAQVDTGPGFEFVRFSAGSAADPRSRVPDWNRTFELIPAAPASGVLLLHGLTDSPYSLRALGRTLHAAGHHVLGLRLPGHGTAPSALLGVVHPA